MKGVCSDKKISRGEIYVADLNPYQSSEQGGIRPVVILPVSYTHLTLPTNSLV